MRPLLAIPLLLVGCVSIESTPDPTSVDGIDTLVAYLNAEGFALEPDGLTSSTFPLAVATTYRVVGTANPTQLEMFEFPTDADAERGLTTLRAEVRARGRQFLYASGPLVVYLRGGDP